MAAASEGRPQRGRAVDALLAPWPPFNRIGDHVLLQFSKRGDRHA
jgi:hypothetical protein